MFLYLFMQKTELPHTEEQTLLHPCSIYRIYYCIHRLLLFQVLHNKLSQIGPNKVSRDPKILLLQNLLLLFQNFSTMGCQSGYFLASNLYEWRFFHGSMQLLKASFSSPLLPTIHGMFSFSQVHQKARPLSPTYIYCIFKFF